MADTGMRVPFNTHAPLTLPGTLSTAEHCDQSRAAIEGTPAQSITLYKSENKPKRAPHQRKGQSDFSDWPLLMPATTGVYRELVEGLPHTWRLQYHRPSGA
jgi:hypothetical protein